MSIRIHRLVVAGMGLCIAPFVANEVEQRRAVMTPFGWRSKEPITEEPLAGAWRIMNSRWRPANDATWISKKSADQLYVRTELTADAAIELSLQANDTDGLWIRIGPNTPATAHRDGEPVICMGSITPPETTAPVELQKQRDGVLVRWSDSTMVCPDPTPPSDGHPRLRIKGSGVEIASIGRDRNRDGLPLSPIWWLASCILWMFPWMLIFDALLGLMPKQAATALPSEE